MRPVGLRPPMIKLCAFFALMLPAALSAAGKLEAVISREVGKCAAAWQREDYATIVAFTPDRVVQQRGGRASLLGELKEHFATAREWGAQSIEITPGPPSPPRKVGRWLVALVPITAVVHGSHLELTQETQVMALSTDGGKRWSFLLLYEMTQGELNGWFPELRGQVRVPVTARPSVTLAY